MTDSTQAANSTQAADSTTQQTDEKRSGRRPEGPRHLRSGETKETLKRTVTEFKEDNLSDWAAALTYYGLLSLFPALLALVSLVGLVADPHTVTRELTKLLREVGGRSAVNTFRQPIASVTSNRSASGVLFVVGLALALWSASGYVGAFMRAANKIYEVEEGRPIYKLRPMQMAVTLGLVLLAAISLVGVVVSGPLAHRVGSAIGVGHAAVLTWEIAKWPVILLIVVLMLAVLYYASPNARLRGLKWITPGGVVALVAWLVASGLFALYVVNFSSYNKTYGSLGGVVLFLVWLWITNLAVLFGAELNAEIERSTEIREGVPGAERELQVDERSQPKPKKRRRTA